MIYMSLMCDEFLYWQNSNGVKIGYDESIKIKKSIVFDDVITAFFAPIVANDNMNGDTGNV